VKTASKEMLEECQDCCFDLLLAQKSYFYIKHNGGFIQSKKPTRAIHLHFFMFLIFRYRFRLHRCEPAPARPLFTALYEYENTISNGRRNTGFARSPCYFPFHTKMAAEA
jgi:hypothetical protein